MRPGSRIRNVIAASVMMLFVTYYVNATDALQSAMEAKRMKNDWLSSVSEAKNAFTRLSSYAGGIAVSGVQDMLPWLMNHIRQPKISWIHMHPPFQKMLKPYWKRVFGYKSGDSRLFELLEAQRAYDEVLIYFMEAQREK